MSKHKKLILIIWFIVFGLWLSIPVCPSPADAQPKYGGTLVMVYHDPGVFNPIVEWGFQAVTALVFDGLIAFDKEGNVIPGLAESWDVSKDAMIYTFKLRKNVKWHDGRPFSSEDVKFTFDTVLDPDKAIPYRKYFESVERVTTPDAHTVVFQLKEPSAPILSRFWMGVIPKHIWEKEDLKKSTYNISPVGTGPWKLIEWVKMDHVTFEANKDYFLGRPYLDKLVMKTIPDAVVAFAALERGDVDFFPFGGLVGGIPYQQVDQLKKKKDLEISVFEVSSQQQLFFRTDEPPFNNLKVRQAVAHAINREFIITNVLFGYGKVVHSVVPPTVKWALNPNVTKYEYNVEKANRLLDEAGYPRKADGIRFKTTIYGTPGARKTFSEIIKEQLRVVGISADLQISDWTTYINQIRVARTHHGIWTVLLIPKTPDPDEGVLYYHSSSIGSGGINPSMYNNPNLDKIVDKARTITDIKERVKLYNEYQEIIARDLPTFPLYLGQGVDIWNKKFQGFYSMDFGGGSITCLPHVWYAGK
jgi:peptide/nickel transport system substrate-binding protein